MKIFITWLYRKYVLWPTLMSLGHPRLQLEYLGRLGGELIKDDFILNHLVETQDITHLRAVK